MEKLFTRKEAAELLGISITTLDAARNNGLIAYVQYGEENDLPQCAEGPSARLMPNYLRPPFHSFLH